MASEPADWETEKAAEVFQAMWMRYPDLKAVYCSNDAMALGVLQQMQEKNCYLPVVGFDNDAVMKEFFLRENWLQQLIFLAHRWLSGALSSLWMYWREK